MSDLSADMSLTVMDDLVSTVFPKSSAHELTPQQGLSADEVGTSSLFSGEEELFAFARCVSRLSQMGYVVFRFWGPARLTAGEKDDGVVRAGGAASRSTLGR